MDWTYCTDGLPKPGQAIFFCVYYDLDEWGIVPQRVRRGTYLWNDPDDAGVQIADDAGELFRIGTSDGQVYAWMYTPGPAPMR